MIKSVTRNGRSILLTALLALILVYLFSIVGFLFLKEDFIMEVDPLPQIAAGNFTHYIHVCLSASRDLTAFDNERKFSLYSFGQIE